jgi:hypothetical protein
MIIRGILAFALRAASKRFLGAFKSRIKQGVLLVVMKGPFEYIAIDVIHSPCPFRSIN